MFAIKNVTQYANLPDVLQIVDETIASAMFGTTKKQVATTFRWPLNPAATFNETTACEQHTGNKIEWFALGE